jgi:hypothetical protein
VINRHCDVARSVTKSSRSVPVLFDLVNASIPIFETRKRDAYFGYSVLPAVVPYFSRRGPSLSLVSQSNVSAALHEKD